MGDTKLQTTIEKIEQYAREHGLFDEMGDLAITWMLEHEHAEDLIGRLWEVAQGESDAVLVPPIL